jgi:hypothetical protein
MGRLLQILVAIRTAWPDRPTGQCWYCDQPICGCNAVVIAKPEGFAGVCLPCFEERSFKRLQDLPFHLVGTPVCEHRPGRARTTTPSYRDNRTAPSQQAHGSLTHHRDRIAQSQ